MTDLENKLRSIIQRKADDAISVVEEAIPPQVVRRVRRRQARNSLIAGVTLGALVFGSILGVRTLLRQGTVGGALEPAGQPFIVHESPLMIADGQFLLASGHSAGEAWDLVAFEDDRGLGLEVRSPGSASGTGDFTVPEERDLEVSARSFGTPPRFEQLIFGVAISEAEEVRLDFQVGGTTVGRLIPLPTGFQDDLKVILIESSAQGEGDIVLTDSEGREIAREPYISVPPPFQPGDPIHQLDHFGNAIGQIPAEKVFSPPPPPGTTEEGFVWTPPGLDAPTDDIRGTARAPLVNIRPAVREWWEGRPEEGATDEAFLDWWSAYPVTEELPGA